MYESVLYSFSGIKLLFVNREDPLFQDRRVVVATQGLHWKAIKGSSNGFYQSLIYVSILSCQGSWCCK